MREPVPLLPLLLCLALAACAPGRASDRPTTAATAGAHGSDPLAAAVTAGARDEDGPVPIYPEDARWGAASAAVTLVAVLDLECPFCARTEPILAALKERYGPARLRIVVKHDPLPFHPHAMRAALSAINVRRAAGDDAFFRFVGTVYAHQAELGEERLATWEAAASGSRAPPPAALRPEQQLARDLDFVKEAGVDGTPMFFVNGARLSGALPLERFTEVIDAELRAVDAARRSGGAAGYGARVAANYRAPAAAEEATGAEDGDGKIWKIPVVGSPVLGPPDALVTVVEFGDYECPYCKRVQATLERLVGQYGKDLRIVFKHDPLPFHPHARPAARLAVEAFREKGDAGFWAANKALFDAPREGLANDALLRIASGLGLDAARATLAIETGVHDAEIAGDEDVAQDFDVQGTPHFFVNGRRLTGAQPYESFAGAVEEALAVAKEMVGKGIPRGKIYETILEVADGPPPPPRVDVGPPPTDRPSRGPASAAVVIQEFSDFQCQFCKRAQPTLEALLREFPKDVRLVWRNLPLDFHGTAKTAANAALEARALRGDAAFWKLHDVFFEHQSELSDDAISDLAKAAGLDGGAIRAAALSGKHDAAISEDLAVAERAGIRGTPGFVVNGYLVSGAQPLAMFRRTVRRALADAGKGGREVARPASARPRPAPPAR